jgi:hypothetical protein
MRLQAIKLSWLALRNVLAKIVRPAYDWKGAMNQFAILFGERLRQQPDTEASTDSHTKCGQVLAAGRIDVGCLSSGLDQSPFSHAAASGRSLGLERTAFRPHRSRYPSGLAMAAIGQKRTFHHWSLDYLQ